MGQGHPSPGALPGVSESGAGQETKGSSVPPTSAQPTGWGGSTPGPRFGSARARRVPGTAQSTHQQRREQRCRARIAHGMQRQPRGPAFGPR